jgi:DNA-damage-inducible protein J
MSNNTSITIRTDKEIKLEAQAILSSLGLDMSTAFNLFLRLVIQKQGLPFNVNLNSPKVSTLKALSETSNNKNLVGPFGTVEDLMNDLDT